MRLRKFTESEAKLVQAVCRKVREVSAALGRHGYQRTTATCVVVALMSLVERARSARCDGRRERETACGARVEGASRLARLVSEIGLMAPRSRSRWRPASLAECCV